MAVSIRYRFGGLTFHVRIGLGGGIGRFLRLHLSGIRRRSRLPLGSGISRFGLDWPVICYQAELVVRLLNVMFGAHWHASG
ncbi:Uncharacterised protein [Mycobacteroides abscessus subsp. abscessus]|nr:Uncharacterised protein [Mycobacteroides abscessus subsp. abscessus]SKR03798.1 Uncharacterised protein [Mycobacteroides abscessus subsp. abscessus]